MKSIINNIVSIVVFPMLLLLYILYSTIRSASDLYKQLVLANKLNKFIWKINIDDIFMNEYGMSQTEFKEKLNETIDQLKEKK